MFFVSDAPKTSLSQLRTRTKFENIQARVDPTLLSRSVELNKRWSMPRKSEYELKARKNSKTKQQRLLERELTAQGTDRGSRRYVARSEPPLPPPSKTIPWYKRRGNGNFFMGMTWKEWFIFTAVVSLGCASWMPLLIKLLKTCRMNLFVSKSKNLTSLCFRCSIRS